MRALVQQLLSLILILMVAANAIETGIVRLLPPGAKPHEGNWFMDPRQTNLACSRRPQIVTLDAGSTVTFSSPGWPSPYPNRQSCSWKFRVSDNTQAASSSNQLTFTCTSFTLQPDTAGRCQDFLGIYNFSLNKGKRYCGTTGPVSATGGPYACVWFQSDRSQSFAGFTCNVSVEGSVVTNAPVTNAPVTSGPVYQCVCGQANRVTRIVGGQTTEVNEYPWQVAVVDRGNSSVFCGGSLINDRWVLTSAHCTQSRVALQVLLGNHLQMSVDSAERRINVRTVVNHPNFNFKTYNNDFSLLELSIPVDLESVDPGIRPICLPTAANPSQYENVDAIVSGWGTTSFGGTVPDALRDATVRTQTNVQCTQAFDANGGANGLAITDAMICASWTGRDSCQGDSGGPLVRKVDAFFRLIGVVSWGSGCARPTFPGVYARVSAEIDWINATSSSGITCAPP